MLKITVDGQEITAKEGTLLIEILRENGKDIPAICYQKELPRYTSCMLCVVYNENTSSLIPSCSVFVKEAMRITTNNEEVIQTRKEALSLLLSEHIGECISPCTRTCPFNVPIEKMLVLIKNQNFIGASALLKKHLPIFRLACSACVGYCEKACRRKNLDSPVKIRNLISSLPTHSKQDVSTQKKNAAVVGESIEAFAAAIYLAYKGIETTLYTTNTISENPLLTDEMKEALKKELLEAQNIPVRICRQKPHRFSDFTFVINASKSEIESARKIEESTSPIHGIKEAIACCLSLLNEKNIYEKIPFVSIRGKINEEELRDRDTSIKSEDENLNEASKCLQCGCMALDYCLLRKYAIEYDVKAYSLNKNSPSIRKEKSYILDTGKCVRCGKCVRLSEKYTEEGFVFHNRSASIFVGEALDYKSEISEDLANIIIKNCVTGALVSPKEMK